jgi:hypothetical protein
VSLALLEGHYPGVLLLTCTKAQLLALLTKLKREMEKCESVECCLGVVNTYILLVEEKAIEEITRELY